MTRILLALAMLLSLTAQAADYPYTGPEHNLVIGQQTDRITFVQTAPKVIVTVHGSQSYVACATKYCDSPGVWRATVQSVTLVNSAGGVVADVTLPTTMPLTPGTYMLVVNATGSGTGSVLGKGYYTVSIVQKQPVQPD